MYSATLIWPLWSQMRPEHRGVWATAVCVESALLCVYVSWRELNDSLNVMFWYVLHFARFRWIVETSLHSTVDLELDISADTFSPPDEGKLMAHCNGTAPCSESHHISASCDLRWFKAAVPMRAPQPAVHLRNLWMNRRKPCETEIKVSLWCSQQIISWSWTTNSTPDYSCICLLHADVIPYACYPIWGKHTCSMEGTKGARSTQSWSQRKNH